MKLIFVRHGDPDYSIDSLTPRGVIEAEALAERMEKIPSDGDFVSPLGRARKTAEIALRGTGRTPEVKQWLREFNYPVKRPRQGDDPDGDCVWDWYPADLVTRPGIYSKDNWMHEPELEAVGIPEAYERVCRGLDELLAEHGYTRDGLLYRAVRPNHETLVFYCHFGLECVLISHLINVSPMVLWHGFAAAPSSVTTLYTEERREGIACFRASAFGDISHLYAAGEEPAFQARFCECFTDDTRH